MTIKNLLVFGATGTQGHPVVDAALDAGLVVHAATRDPAEAEEKLSAEAEIVYADLTDSESLGDALSGMDAVFFHPPILPDADQGPRIVTNLIECARSAGVRQLVVTTGAWCAEDLVDCPFAVSLRGMAQEFLDSGLDVVVLRPTLYLANLVWPNLIREIRDFGRLSYPPLSVKRRLNWTATEDQGRIAVACLRQGISGEIIDIASPQSVTGPELCRMLAGVYGREVHYAPQSVDDFADTLSHMSGSAPVARAVSGLYAAIDRLPGDGPLVDTDALEKRLDIRLTPVSEWVEERLGALLELYG